MVKASNDLVLIDSDDEDVKSNKRFKLDTPDLFEFGSSFRNTLYTPVDDESKSSRSSDKSLELANNEKPMLSGSKLKHDTDDDKFSGDGTNIDENEVSGNGAHIDDKDVDEERYNVSLEISKLDKPNISNHCDNDNDNDNDNDSSTSNEDEFLGKTSFRAPVEISSRLPAGANLQLEDDPDAHDDDDISDQPEFDCNDSEGDDSSLDQLQLEDTPQFSPETILETRKYLKNNGNMKFLEKYLPTAASSEDIVRLIIQLGFVPKIHNSVNMMDLVQSLNRAMIKVKSIRNRLENITTFDDAIKQIESCSKIMVITGAGISTSLGIPDFRSSQGFYSQVKHLGLNDPQEVFDLENFHIDPSLFYSIAYMIIPSEKTYSPLHAFIKLLQDKGKLLRNYTQNIDNLESYAGILPEKLIQCHGSFATASCVTCGYQVPGESIFDSIRSKEISYCPKCSKLRQKLLKNEDNYIPESYGVFKPDITFFGEPLPKLFHDQIVQDLNECDLLISIGTSLKVAPVADIVDKIPDHVPQLLINKDPINHCNFDVSLLGYCDDVASFISYKLGDSWAIPHQKYNEICGEHGSNLRIELSDEKFREYKIINLQTEALKQENLKENKLVDSKEENSERSIIDANTQEDSERSIIEANTQEDSEQQNLDDLKKGKLQNNLDVLEKNKLQEQKLNDLNCEISDKATSILITDVK